MVILTLQRSEKILETLSCRLMLLHIAKAMENHVVIFVDEHHHLVARLPFCGMDKVSEAQIGICF